MTDEFDYDLYEEVIQSLLDVMWRNEHSLTVGEDISDIPGVKIIFDGYGDLEITDENGEYVDTEESGNKNQESYAVFIHRRSGEADFEFPEHQQTPWALIHRPGEEICVHVWYDVEEDEWTIQSFDDLSSHELTDEEVTTALLAIKDRWFKHPENDE